MIGRQLPPLSQQGIAYAWRQLAHRFGGDVSLEGTSFNNLGVPFYYSQPERVRSDQPCVIVVPCANDAWKKLLERAPNSLDWLSTNEVIPSGAELLFADLIPVLFWGEGYKDGHNPFARRRDDGSIVFYADIIAATFFMLSRWMETVIPTRDHHDRFPATASVAYKQGILDRPIVDEYAMILGVWLSTVVSSWTPHPRQFTIKISHDIDWIRSAPLRTLGKAVLKRRSLSKALQTVQQIVRPQTDQYLRGCYELADLAENNGFETAFYFMAAGRGTFDSGYDPRTKPVQDLMGELRKRGHEVGFHPGYDTFLNPEGFMVEKHRMDEALGGGKYGGRQHYLRFRSPDTWRLWEQAGLYYDSTLGYADHEGFRCGTCHPFHPFDIKQDRQLDLLEIPLIVMDGTLKQYHNLTPEEGRERILTLAEQCKWVNGMFTLLWHNSSLWDEWEPWAIMYRRVLPRLAEMEGQTTSRGNQERP